MEEGAQIYPIFNDQEWQRFFEQINEELDSYMQYLFSEEQTLVKHEDVPQDILCGMVLIKFRDSKITTRTWTGKADICLYKDGRYKIKMHDDTILLHATSQKNLRRSLRKRKSPSRYNMYLTNVK
jgi:hypothetical protein